jgi:hypothetical protein
LGFQEFSLKFKDVLTSVGKFLLKSLLSNLKRFTPSKGFIVLSFKVLSNVKFLGKNGNSFEVGSNILLLLSDGLLV